METLSANKITAVELKKINRNRIYKLIYNKKEISRQDISLELDLSLPTVNQNLKELTEIGLIDYSGSFKSTGGRKAQAIVPIKDAKVAVGLDIRKNSIRILAIDLYGNVLDYEKYIKTFAEQDEYGRYVAYLVKNMIEHNHFPADKVLGVGISVPGVLNENMEYISLAPSLNVSQYPINIITRYIDYPFIVDNDANSGAFAEIWNNGESDSKIYFLVEKGVGGCIITEDGMYKGVHNRAGEFGHTTIFPNGRICNCGNKGCLEAYISVSRISEDLGCQLEDFFVGLAAGNLEYKCVWDEYMEYLCLGINNIHMAFDCDIILGGLLTQYLEPYVGDIRKKLEKLNSFESKGDYLYLAKYQSKATAVGAALQMVEKFIDEI